VELVRATEAARALISIVVAVIAVTCLREKIGPFGAGFMAF
jgi:hypothetical protein